MPIEVQQEPSAVVREGPKLSVGDGSGALLKQRTTKRPFFRRRRSG